MPTHVLIPSAPPLVSYHQNRRGILLREANRMSGVFRNIDPQPPHRPPSVYPSAFGAGGKHTRGAERGWGVNSSEDSRHCSALYMCKYFVTRIQYTLFITLKLPPPPLKFKINPFSTRNSPYTFPPSLIPLPVCLTYSLSPLLTLLHPNPPLPPQPCKPVAPGQKFSH
jgi:hypothetical protein